MADRQTLNVSLPPAQEQFVRAQVASGRYQSASEVVREGLRLLERAEHQRLLEKWLYEGLSAEEEARLPAELLAKAKAHMAKLVEEGIAEIREGRVIDGETAMKQIRERLAARRGKKSA